MTLYGLAMNYDKLTQKKQALDSYRPLPVNLVKNLDNWFRVELTYTSNALEGNTLTRKETALVLEKGLTVGGKSLNEHIEATNHAQALDFIKSLITKKPSAIKADDIMFIHKIILKSIDDDNAGHFRNVAVRISGSSVVLPNYRKVPELMAEFHNWLINCVNMHPIALAAQAHYRLVSIHPFIDGNGRTARLLMNLLLMMHGYPPAIIRKRDRLAYISSLEKAQLGGSIDNYEKIINKAVNRSLDIYLNALKDKHSVDDLDNDNLLKIGALAKSSKVAVSTIRHWLKEGLIEVAFLTPSGYQLFAPDMIKRCEDIHKLKLKRLTISEIKNYLKKHT